MENIDSFDSVNDEIEKLAWQVFLDNLGLCFKRELTADEKKSITDNEDYQYYRDTAKKIYEEKQLRKEKALLSKKYKVIDVPASGKRGWMGGAYTLTFVYSKHNGNFVLRGYIGEVQEYLKKNYTHYFCNMVLFGGYRYRNIWKFWKDSVGIFEPVIKSRYEKRNRKYRVSQYSDLGGSSETKTSYEFKRLPKRWIPEFDAF